jgi:hypothetical protein
MLSDFIKLSNENEGFISILLFIIALLFGWISGIFRALRRRPRIKIDIIEGPTLCTTFETGREYEGYKTHKTAISLYLNLTNIGNAPSSIGEITIGYRCVLAKFRWLGIRHTIRWLRDAIKWQWLEGPIVALSDFKRQIGESTLIYPFLIQATCHTEQRPETYLRVGEKVNGIVYFEQYEAYGVFCPRTKEGNTKIKVRIRDAFGKLHSSVVSVPVVSLSEAREFCDTFGEHGEALSRK